MPCSNTGTHTLHTHSDISLCFPWGLPISQVAGPPCLCCYFYIVKKLYILFSLCLDSQYTSVMGYYGISFYIFILFLVLIYIQMMYSCLKVCTCNEIVWTVEGMLEVDGKFRGCLNSIWTRVCRCLAELDCLVSHVKKAMCRRWLSSGHVMMSYGLMSAHAP